MKKYFIVRKSQGDNWALTTKYGKYGLFKNKNMTKIWDFG